MFKKNKNRKTLGRRGRKSDTSALSFCDRSNKKNIKTIWGAGTSFVKRSFCLLFLKDKAPKKRKQATKERPFPEIRDYFNNLSDFLDSGWGNAEIHSSAFAELQRIERFLQGIRRIGKLLLVFSYKMTIFGLIIILVYSLSPLALSAPQSISVTTKINWERGSLNDVSTESLVDSIQLKSEGTWTARVWAPPFDTVGAGSSTEIVRNYMYVSRGYSDKAFWRYDTENNDWDEIEDLPFPAYYGADMAKDNEGNIYMTFRGFSQNFYQYDIDNEEWSQLPDLPDTVWTGSGIAFDGEDFFVNRGNNSTDFWKFDVSENAWANLAPTLANISTGANLVYGENGYLYLNRGANTQDFYRYNIGDNQWETRTGTPSTSYRFNGEQKAAYHDGYIYYFKSAGTTDFLRYNISGDSWEILNNSPLAANYCSLVFNDNDDLVYALRGNGTYDLWKFDPLIGSSGDWIGPEQVMNGTGTIGTGGDLLWNKQTGTGGRL